MEDLRVYLLSYFVCDTFFHLNVRTTKCEYEASCSMAWFRDVIADISHACITRRTKNGFLLNRKSCDVADRK